MHLIVVDFETYYDKEFSLSKMTTEEYIRDDRFEVIGIGIKLDNNETQWASGTQEEINEFLQGFPWAKSMVVAHNAMFDAAILSWRFGISPRVWADTLCIGRALHGVQVGGSLASLAQRYKIGEKGNEVVSALGKRRLDFTVEELARYGDYCINDVDLTFQLFDIMAPRLPKEELRLIDITLRMFTNPVLDLDIPLLETHLIDIQERKDQLLVDAGITDKKDLMSNDKFAALLKDEGVVPPRKVSARTGKETWAFAKSDKEFKELLDHENTNVQALVAARLGNKSTLEETRTQRFLDIAHRGLLPVPIKYYAAHTGRWGGSDKINMQNLPSRGPDAKVLKKAIIPPAGHVIVEADSSQIEARVLAWLAEQNDLVDAFARKEDVYKKMASAIYNVPVDGVTKDQRFIGKTTILGAGYGMGAVRFKEQSRTMGVDLSLEESRRIIDIYRKTNGAIRQLWYDCTTMLTHMVQGDRFDAGRFGILKPVPKENAIQLPNGLFLRYDKLHAKLVEGRHEYFYKTRQGDTRIYGGKVVENVCQAIARAIIGYQMIQINKKYRVVMTVHDSIVCCVPESEAEDAKAYVEECMRSLPDWAEGLPIDCEAGIGKSYGDCD